jgi:hypothetical protein
MTKYQIYKYKKKVLLNETSKLFKIIPNEMILLDAPEKQK